MDKENQVPSTNVLSFKDEKEKLDRKVNAKTQVFAKHLENLFEPFPSR